MFVRRRYTPREILALAAVCASPLAGFRNAFCKNGRKCSLLVSLTAFSFCSIKKEGFIWDKATKWLKDARKSSIYLLVQQKQIHKQTIDNPCPPLSLTGQSSVDYSQSLFQSCFRVKLFWGSLSLPCLMSWEEDTGRFGGCDGGGGDVKGRDVQESQDRQGGN